MAHKPPDYRPVNRAIGNGLRLMREERCYSLANMAELLHTDLQTLHAYESGLIPIPAATLLHADMILQAGLQFYTHPFRRLTDLYRLDDNVILFPGRLNV